jgi:2'-5' RNA ligase
MWRMAKIRSFLAFELPPSILSKIGKIQDRLKACRADARWVTVEQIHLTLKFFGSIEEKHIVDISAIMEDAAVKRSAFTLSVKGLGAFPSTRNPRVIWLGLHGWEENLLPLQREIETRLEAVSFVPEERPYRPHLTLGRVKSLKVKEDLVDLIERERDVNIGHFVVDRIVLFRSDLRPTGPIYTPLTTRELAGG